MQQDYSSDLKLMGAAAVFNQKVEGNCNNTPSVLILIITVTVFTDSVQCSSVSAGLILRDQLFNSVQTYHAFLIWARLVQSCLFRDPREKLQMVAYREVLTLCFSQTSDRAEA